MRKLILRNLQSPGDLVVLSAAVRDLHKQYPGEFLTDVRSTYPQLWESNPYLASLDEKAKDVEVIECQYPLIHQSNQLPRHFIEAFHEFLAAKLGVPLRPTAFKGDIHLSPREKSWTPQVQEIVGRAIPYWIIVAGGKKDFTIKWWSQERFQEVVDHFRDKIAFVQVGERCDVHPPLDGVLDMRGKTDLRQLIRLVYHAQGVLCPVTLHMHLAAAVPRKPKIVEQAQDAKLVPGVRRITLNPSFRPCVVVAGGREPAQWEAYPGHQFLQTIGALPCCAGGGCWKSRTKPLGDGDAKDKPENLCQDVVNGLPRCMEMIKAQDVIRAVELYFSGGVCQLITPEDGRAFRTKANRMNSTPTPPTAGQAQSKAHPAQVPLSAGGGDPRQALAGNGILHEKTARPEMEKYMAAIPPYPNGYKGRGIVICGGGTKYFPCAWVCINMLRRSGCQLPVQLWHLGPEEMDEKMSALIRPLGVECVDALEVRKQNPARRLTGWESKPYAILHSPFQEVLFLDADNVPVANPEYLFETTEYQDTGAILWPDRSRMKREDPIWRICGIEPREEPETESGQLVVDKARCWRELRLTMWMNEHSDFFYRYFYGDKETFHLAWRKYGRAYAMPAKPLLDLAGTMCQHDLEGRRIFQHRSHPKWQLGANNPSVAGFLQEEECLDFLAQLRKLCFGSERDSRRARSEAEIKAAQELSATTYLYVLVGYGHRPMRFRSDGLVGMGADRCEVFWQLELENGTLRLDVHSQNGRTFSVRKEPDGIWRGAWEIQEKTPVQLVPVPNQLLAGRPVPAPHGAKADGGPAATPLALR